MKKQTVQVDATRRKTVEITLVDDVKTLEDVVVTGYSNVRKSSFTGSSTQISGDDLRKVSQTNIIGAIQSFDPSFRLVDNVQFGSDPNALHEADLLMLDISKVKFQLGWEPRMNIDQTVRLTVDWYRRYQKEEMYKVCVEQIEKYIR
jgi:dTDP-D-glucose 4,6-dehydratase